MTMKRFFFFLLSAWAFSFAVQGGVVKLAILSDVHVTPGNANEGQLREAVVEINNENERLEMRNERSLTSHLDFVTDCSLDSDLEMYFPDQYVPSDSERMLLYRELDGLQTDEQLAAYRTRLVDRFGPVPHVGEELMQVVPLRRYGKALGCEKIVLKQDRMTMFFV